jgi:hypothetical protein
VNGVPLDSVSYCKAWYTDGMRHYMLTDPRWGSEASLFVWVVAPADMEGAIWMFEMENFSQIKVRFQARVCEIANPKLKRNGDIGADKPGVFEPSPTEKGLVVREWEDSYRSFFAIDSASHVADMEPAEME